MSREARIGGATLGTVTITLTVAVLMLMMAVTVIAGVMYVFPA
jgi:hypothetical protein